MGPVPAHQYYPSSIVRRAYFNMLTGVASATPLAQIATPVSRVCHRSGRPPYAEAYFLQWGLLDTKLEPAVTVSACPVPLLTEDNTL